MVRVLRALFILIAFVGFTNCTKESELTKPLSNNNQLLTNGKSLQLAIACEGPLQDSIKNLHLNVKINDIDSFHCKLEKGNKELTTNVDNVKCGEKQKIEFELTDTTGKIIYKGDTIAEISKDEEQNIGITLKHNSESKKIHSCVRSHCDTTKAKNILAPFVVDKNTVFLSHMGPYIWVDGADITDSLKDEVNGAKGEIVGANYKTSLFGVGVCLDTNVGKSWVLFKDTDLLDLDSGTMEAVVYSSGFDGDFNHIIDKSWLYGLTTKYGKLAVHFGDGWWYSNVTLTEGWHYIAATHSGKKLTLYLDGFAVDSSNSYEGTGNKSYDLGIGNASASSHNVPFHGVIDEIRLSKSVRSALEISTIWKIVLERINKY